MAVRFPLLRRTSSYLTPKKEGNRIPSALKAAQHNANSSFDLEKSVAGAKKLADGQHQEGARARREVWSPGLGARPSSFLPPVGIGLLSLLKQFIGQRSRRATLDLFNDRGRGSAVYVYPRLPR